jgi:arylsulfatase A
MPDIRFDRREFVKTIGLVAASLALPRGLACGLPDGEEESTPKRPPNFIVIVADDLGYGDLSCYGSKTIKTPRIDGMAAEGMKFSCFYSAASICSPSRAGLLTGCYPLRIGFQAVLYPNSMRLGVGNRDEAIGLNSEEVTVAELLGKRGYATSCIGKWHLGDQPEFLPTRHGFDEYFGLPYNNDMRPESSVKDFPPLPLIRNEKIIETNPDQGLLEQRFTDEAIRFIRENRERPFFLYLGHNTPHPPIHVSERFLKRFSKEQLEGIKEFDKGSRDFLFPAAVEEIDWNTGRILDVLTELGLDESTMVLFTSDNGPAVGSAGPLRRGKGSVFEGGMRVPCVMRWSGTIPAGTVCDEVVSAIDLLPTFAALAGEPVADSKIDGRDIDGGDIGPLLRGEPGARSPHEVYFYGTGRRCAAAVRSGKWKLHIRERRGVFSPKELYDLETDIGEEADLSAENPAVVKRLIDLARSFDSGLKEKGRLIGTAPVRESDEPEK